MKMPATTPGGWRTRRQLDRLEHRPRAASDSFSFAVIGDAEPGRFLLNRLLFGERDVFFSQLRGIAREDVDFILQLGDMVSRGVPEQYAAFLAGLERHCPEVPYLTVLGNHDRRQPHDRSDATLYRTHFGEPNYAFDRGPARFVVLDTSCDGLRDSQLRWLDRALGTGRRKLVFMHKPPAGLGRLAAGKLGGFRRRDAALMRLLSRRGADRVYMGHIHGFSRAVVDGVTYVLSGGGGSPLYPSLADHRFYHYLVVEVGPDGVRETVQKLDGERVDAPRLDRRPAELPARLQARALSAAALLALLAARIPH